MSQSLRIRFADLVEKLISGEISNFEYEARSFDEILKTSHRKSKSRRSDPFLWTMWSMTWLLYSDTREYRLVGPDELNHQSRKTARRYIMFLRSGRQYEWPFFDAVWPAGMLREFVTLGWAKRSAWRRFKSFGDFSIWPYLQKTDLDCDLREFAT